jgi:SAM-dependent methyltransferase
MREDLKKAFENHDWSGKRGKAPRSGPGSTLAATERLRTALPQIFEQLKIRRFLDAPCGDWTWMQTVDLSQLETYHGVDISTSVIQDVSEKFTSDKVSFSVLDVCSDPLPAADLIMCRECLFHLKHEAKWAFFQNALAVDIAFIMFSIDHIRLNHDLLRNGGFRRFNPMMEPFNFPLPLYYVHETTNQDMFDVYDPDLGHRQHRSMGIWTREMIANAMPQSQPQQTSN